MQRQSRSACVWVIVLAAACSSEVTAPGVDSNDRRDGDSAGDADGDTPNLPIVALQHATFVLDEGDPDATLSIVSDRPLADDAVITLAYAGTFSDDDFLVRPVSIRIAKGQTSASAAIVLAADLRVEEYKTLEVSLATSAVVSLERSTYTFTVVDDDALLLNVSGFYDGSVLANEHAAEGTPTPARRTIHYNLPDGGIDPVPLDASIRTIGAVDFDVKLELASMVGTLGPDDIVEDLEHIVLPANATEYTWAATARQDDIPEGVEYAVLRYRAVNVKTLLGRAGDGLIEIELRVFDDEIVSVQLKRTGPCAASFEIVEAEARVCSLVVERTGDPAGGLDIQLAYSGTATFGADFTGPTHVAFSPGESSTSFDIAIVDDAILEDREELTVRLAEAAGFSCFCSEGATYGIGQSDMSPEGRSIEITGQATRGSVILDWSDDFADASFEVYRRVLGETTWGTARATLPAGVRGYTDTDVSAGTTYEYKVQRNTGVGFAAVAFQQPAVHYRGRVLLVVETGVAAQLASELDGLRADLAGDGWSVVDATVAASDTPANVKHIVTTHYDEPASLGAVILFGHVPVPYSGWMAPDGHPDHSGAWPADGYYGDIDGAWTDLVVDTSTATRPENRNVPGDGKLDQSTYPSAVELAVGRIDMFDMPDFAPLTEVDLLRRYLQKLRSYRRAVVVPTRRALIDDNFGDFSGEAFARAAWNWFGNIVGRDQTFARDWLSELSVNDYLWAYGCGGGGYDRADGIGTTADLAHASLNVVFTSLFGSYFGDWGASNNFLRGVLAADGRALTAAWSGRPSWTFHALAAGEPMATSIRSTWNNPSYFANVAERGVHTGFLGDPTLRDHMHPPVANLTSTPLGDSVRLAWDDDAAATGYFVYASRERYAGYVLVTPTALDASEAVVPTDAEHRYVMVRSRRSLSTFGGSFETLSVGVVVSTE